MKEVKTWKEFYSYVPEELKSDWNKKCYRKLFSLAAKNYFTVLTDGALFYFEKKTEDYVFYSDNYGHIQRDSFIGYPETIHLCYFRCIATGYETKYKYGERVEVIKSQSGEFKFDYIITDTLPFKDVTFCGLKTQLTGTYYHDKEYLEQIDWKDSGSYSAYLVLKDHLWYKKGQIRDMYYMYEDYYKRNPLSLFEDFYRINCSVSCDLNLVTLEQLEKIDTNSFSCNKYKFGCQRGCTHHCMAESVNNYQARIKKYFIKTFKRLNL